MRGVFATKKSLVVENCSRLLTSNPQDLEQKVADLLVSKGGKGRAEKVDKTKRLRGEAFFMQQAIDEARAKADRNTPFGSMTDEVQDRLNTMAVTVLENQVVRTMRTIGRMIPVGIFAKVGHVFPRGYDRPLEDVFPLAIF